MIANIKIRSIDKTKQLTKIICHVDKAILVKPYPNVGNIQIVETSKANNTKDNIMLFLLLLYLIKQLLISIAIKIFNQIVMQKTST